MKPMRNGQYDELMVFAMYQSALEVFNEKLCDRELYEFLSAVSDQKCLAKFWNIVRSRVPPIGKHDVKTYYMKYFTRRYFSPLGDVRRYEMARYLCYLRKCDLSNAAKQLVLNYGDVHPSVIRNFVQHVSREIELGVLDIDRYKRRSIESTAESAAVEARHNVGYGNLEPSVEESLEETSESFGSISEHSSFKEDEEFRALNASRKRLSFEEYEERLMKIMTKAATQFSKSQFISDLQVFRYYEKHKDLFKSLWRKITLPPALPDTSTKLYFEQIMWAYRLPPLNQEQLNYLLDRAKDLFGATDSKIEAFAWQTEKHPLFKDCSTEMQIEYAARLIVNELDYCRRILKLNFAKSIERLKRLDFWKQAQQLLKQHIGPSYCKQRIRRKITFKRRLSAIFKDNLISQTRVQESSDRDPANENGLKVEVLMPENAVLRLGTGRNINLELMKTVSSAIRRV